MPSVELTEEEWQQVISIIASSNPLLMKIADQVRKAGNSGTLFPAEKDKASGVRGRGQGS